MGDSSMVYPAATLLIWCALVACSQSDGFDTLCRSNRHVIGKWVFNPAATKSFECCSWDKEGFYGNTPAKCGHSPLGYPNTYNGQPGKVSQTGGHACLCDRSSRKEVKDREKYEWGPSYCELLQWNSTQFCEILGKRTVLMVGDSTMQQTASTLMSLIAQSGGECAPQITSSRSDLLSADARHNYDKYVTQQKADICILGVGCAEVVHINTAEHSRDYARCCRPQVAHSSSWEESLRNAIICCSTLWNVAVFDGQGH